MAKGLPLLFSLFQNDRQNSHDTVAKQNWSPSSAQDELILHAVEKDQGTNPHVIVLSTFFCYNPSLVAFRYPRHTQGNRMGESVISKVQHLHLRKVSSGFCHQILEHNAEHQMPFKELWPQRSFNCGCPALFGMKQHGSRHFLMCSNMPFR
jgi:hypothetical protein